jgi:glutathione synthase/RimK-type ligase-like ATP-grasp enzyme
MSGALVVLDSSPYGNAADQRSNRFLVELAAWLGCRGRVVDAAELVAGAGAEAGPFAADDVVVPRADLRTFADLARFAALLRALARGGVQLLLDADGLLAAQDKLRTAERLAAAGLPAIPTWGIAASATLSDAVAARARELGFPVVLRHPIGWGARGITRCADLDELRSALGFADHLAPHEPLLLQPFVPHRSALTVQACGGEVAGAYRTWPRAGDFRCNPRLGGRTEKLPAPPALAQLVQRTLAACGLAFGSVDVLEADDGRLLVADVNAMPGLWPRERGDRRFAEALVRLACPGAVRARRVLLLVPFALRMGRGNSVSAVRLVDALRAEAVIVEVLELDELDPAAAVARARAFDPDLVHAIHGLHAGPTGARIATALQVPLVLSFRGTDADDLLDDRTTRGQIAFAAAAATVITALTSAQAARVRAELNPRAEVRVVAHGVRPSPSVRDFRRELGVPAAAPLLVHASGVRRVKGFPQALELVDVARARVPDLRYALAGPLLEPELAPALAAWFAARPWARQLGELSAADAQALIAAGTVTLHTSVREGLSNALLESLALGVPAVARDIDATRAALDGSGVTFRDDQEAAGAVARIAGDAELAARLGAAGREVAAERFSPEAELEGYLEVYRAALAARG